MKLIRQEISSLQIFADGRGRRFARTLDTWYTIDKSSSNDLMLRAVENLSLCKRLTLEYKKLLRMYLCTP